MAPAPSPASTHEALVHKHRSWFPAHVGPQSAQKVWSAGLRPAPGHPAPRGKRNRSGVRTQRVYAPATTTFCLCGCACHQTAKSSSSDRLPPLVRSPQWRRTSPGGNSPKVACWLCVSDTTTNVHSWPSFPTMAAPTDLCGALCPAAGPCPRGSLETPLSPRAQRFSERESPRGGVVCRRRRLRRVATAAGVGRGPYVTGASVRQVRRGLGNCAPTQGLAAAAALLFATYEACFKRESHSG